MGSGKDSIGSTRLAVVQSRRASAAAGARSHTCDKYAWTTEGSGAPNDYVTGANITGFVGVAESMRALGVCLAAAQGWRLKVRPPGGTDGRRAIRVVARREATVPLGREEFSIRVSSVRAVTAEAR